MAGGAGGQYIAVVPTLDLVVAHKTVAGDGVDVSVGRFLSILDLIVAAKLGTAEHIEVGVGENALREYVGNYELAPGAIMVQGQAQELDCTVEDLGELAGRARFARRPAESASGSHQGILARKHLRVRGWR